MITRWISIASVALATGPVLSSAAVLDVGSAAASAAPAAASPANPFLPPDVAPPSYPPERAVPSPDDADLLDEFLGSLRVLQDAYFQPWLGTWPKAIDWTAAVMATHVAGSLSSLSQALLASKDLQARENMITTYFSQLLSYYFGQDAFSIRNEAFDDMLWVVLGWLELIEFVNYHTTIYSPLEDSGSSSSSSGGGARLGSAPLWPAAQDMSEILRNQTWYGNLWVPAFAHRARLFWDLSSHGWNTTLCGGGMLWNPRLEPYKNAITNELYIASSVSMYLYFPGDANTSPFGDTTGGWVGDRSKDDTDNPDDSRLPHEQKHLQAAIDGYRWLADAGMTNAKGLYTDGFHITGWSNSSNPNTKCDARNDMVYTYNQGVLLTGQINLWKVTGDEAYLADGHRLIQAVISATGYDLSRDSPADDISKLKPGQLPPWRGLGRAGILEEVCDVAGTCSQDSQTFKGIFFHHLTAFCAPLEMIAGNGNKKDKSDKSNGSENSGSSSKSAPDFHEEACAAYLNWIRHNAVAALATRDADGKFGMWWTASLLDIVSPSLQDTSPTDGGVDYRTYGVPQDDIWMSPQAPPSRADFGDSAGHGQRPLADSPTKRYKKRQSRPRAEAGGQTDPNTRGRGRTVETQGGGVAVLRALWEISNRTKR